MILLIDGNNLAFVSNSVGALSRNDGFPTQGISNFLKSVRSYIGLFEANKVFIAWDGGKSRQRLAKLPTYKEGRAVEKKTPEQKMNLQEVLAQLPFIKQAVADLGLYQLGGPGIEGDDMIALMAKKADQIGEDAVIISSDSDFHQLVTPKVSIYSTMNKKTGRHVTFDNFSKIYDGLRPDQFLEYKALQGDDGDDVPGIKGIGPATALKLLTAFDSVDKWRHLVEGGSLNPNKTQQKIVDGWETFKISKALIDLHNPLADFSTAKIERQEPNWGAVRQLAVEMQIAAIFVDFASWVKPFKELS